MNKQENNQLQVIQPIQKLMHQEVNRTQFLRIVGLGILSLAGLGPIIHFLTGKSLSGKAALDKNQPRSFGAGAYGV